MYKRSFLLFFILLLAFYLHAQDLNLKFRRFSIDNGLPHTDVLCVSQDDLGFIWLGTNGGLCRLDGFNIKKFVNRNSSLNYVYNNRIKDLSISPKGIIWLAPEKGLVVFDKQKEKFYNQKNFNFPINKLFVGDDEIVFLVYKNKLEAYAWDVNKGLEKVKLNGYREGSIISGFKKNPLVNEVWAATNNGLLQIKSQGKDKEVTELQVVDQNAKSQAVSSLFFRDNGDLILGVENGYIILNQKALKQKGKSLIGRFIAISPSILNLMNDQSHMIQSLVEDENGSAWVASKNGVAQLKSWDSGQVVQFFSNKTRIKLSSEQLTGLYKDKSGCLWITSINGGADILDLNIKKFYSLTSDDKRPLQSMSDKHARTLMEDNEGNLWIGTRTDGINIVNLNSNKWRYLRKGDKSSGLSSNNIRSLNKDQKGRIWVGTDIGIDVFENNKFHQIGVGESSSNPLSGKNIFSISVDIFGQIWAGSWDKGINIIKYKSSKEYKVEHILKGEKGLCGEKVSFIYADPQRPEIFVSTSEGLNHIILNATGGISKIYHYVGIEGNEQTLSSNYVWPIVRADAKTLWVGTIGGGLNKITLLDDGKYIAKAYSKGFSSIDIENLLSDTKGNLWIGNKGLNVFDPDKNQITNYDINDGLQSNSFKIGSAWLGRSGRMYFGGKEGVTYFYPDSVLNIQQNKKVFFTGLIVNNQNIEVGNKYNGQIILESALENQKVLIFNHLQKTFDLQFSTLQFANPEKIRFRYKLEPFNTDWIESEGTIHSASFANLDAGEYLLKVMVSENGTTLSNENYLSSIKIKILPPWWLSIWAKLIYFLIFCGLVYLAWSWLRMRRNLHIQKIEEQKTEELHQLRVQFFTNISHELRTPLSLISAPVEKVIGYPDLPYEKRSHQYDLIQRNANRLLNLVNELLEFRKVDSGTRRLATTQTDLPRFLFKICEDFQEIASKRNINFELNLPISDKVNTWIDRAVIEKVLVNLLSNAFKYTNPGGVIKVSMPESDGGSFANVLKINVDTSPSNNELVWFSVSDNGIGLDKEELNKVFDRFYRVTDAEQDGQMGSGIGLAFVRSLITLHRGCISVFSEKGKGTEFLIGLQKGSSHLKPEEIMIADEVVASSATPLYSFGEDNLLNIEDALYEIENSPIVENGHSNKKPKLLIIEDNSELCQFLSENFIEEYRIMSAANGKEGYIMAQEFLPDLIISDIMMPEMDGIDLCKAIKSNDATAHISIVLLTAKNSLETRIEAVEVEADAYITKPFSLILLNATLKNLLKSKKRLKERVINKNLKEAHDLTTNQRDREFVDKMIITIEDNLEDSEFDVEKICRTMGISRTVLYDKVNLITGKPIGDFIRKMRLEKAAKLLVTENLPVNTVMDRVGIQSPSYFSKAFKKEFGKTPSQYLNDFLESQ